MATILHERTWPNHSLGVATAVISIKLPKTPLSAQGPTAFKEKKLSEDNLTALTFSLAIEWYHQNSRVVM